MRRGKKISDMILRIEILRVIRRINGKGKMVKECREEW